MSAIDTALHAAAEAIRALPDRELVALALAAPVGTGQAQTVVDSAGHARPVTASAPKHEAREAITIRLGNAAVQEAAKRDPRPTRAAPQRRGDRHDARTLIIERLAQGPATWGELRVTASPPLSASSISGVLERCEHLIERFGERPSRYRLRQRSPNGASPSAPPSHGPSTSTESP